MYKQLSRWFVATLIVSVSQASVQTSVQESVARSVKDVRVLSPEWICVVVDPTEEILAERQERFGAELAADQERFLSGKDTWYFAFSKGFRTLLVQQSYHLPLFAKFNQAGYWKVNGVTPTDVTVWSHSVDGFPGWSAADAPTCDTRNESRTTDMVYLKLPSALRSGEQIEVKGEDGRAGVLTFNDESTVCWSIKVNQSAYSRTAAKKAAYLGLWLPGIGALDCSAFAGKAFHLKKFVKGTRWDGGTSTGEPVFTGKIALRKKFAEQDVKREGGSNLTGEDVYELDFSAFQGEGLYCIQIPGLGRSWPFEVTQSGYGAAFYTMMKGLYTQRCGMELKRPFTAWERPACHLGSKLGQYISETANWYLNRYRQGETNQNLVGFRDAAGQRIGLSQFTLIGNSNSNSPVMSGVKGGWHDAADFDRRIYHYGVVSDLLAAFEAFPAHFRDAQLNIPESSNGIPDILDEAAYGVDVWRSTQRKDGAVSSWIEQESHPAHSKGSFEKTFTDNQLEMFMAVPDRASAYAYAAAAAWLGRLLAPYSSARSKDYLESARRAYSWARDDANTLRDRTFAISKPMRDAKLKGTTIRFDEDPQFKESDMGYADKAFAAANLYFATKDDMYLKDWTASSFGQRYPALASGINPSQCMPLLLNQGLPPAETAAMKQSLLKAADQLVASQNDNPYRMLWLSPADGWFHAMAWGNIHRKSRVLVAAYAISRDPKYRASMENAADFFLGCNPLGSTLVTGIGSVYPVVIQHIHSLADGIADPTPGIAPYTLTFGIPLRPFLVVDKGHASVKSYFNNVALAFIPDKLGRKEIQAGLDSFEKKGDWEKAASANGRKAIWDNFPVLRRKVIHPGAAVDQNEFTINETISPLALLFGALTDETWVPSDELKNRQPRRKIEELPFYSMP
jgi:hypothetical protein